MSATSAGKLDTFFRERGLIPTRSETTYRGVSIMNFYVDDDDDKGVIVIDSVRSDDFLCVARNHDRSESIVLSNPLTFDDGLRVSFGGNVTVIPFSTKKVVFSEHSGSATAAYFFVGHEFTKRNDDLMRENERLHSDRIAATRQARAVLSHARTLKQLLAVWPEVAPFVADIAAAPGSQSTALAIPVAELNRRFGRRGK